MQRSVHARRATPLRLHGGGSGGLRPAHPLQWLVRHDPDLAALRRAGRAAIVMPAMFAVTDKLLGDPVLALFAAFGSFAMLLLVDFGGPMRARLQAQATLAVAGSALVCLGTLASQSVWLAAATTIAVGFAVIFAGVVSSVLAGASTSLLLAFILPVTIPAPVSAAPDRVAGWAMAGAASMIAVALLWPAPTRDALRSAALGACRALAGRLRAEVAYAMSDARNRSAGDRDRAVELANGAISELDRRFLATPYRPTGLSTAARTVVRLVDELSWLNAIVVESAHPAEDAPVDRAACAVRVAAAAVLERAAELLEITGGDCRELRAAMTRLSDASGGLEDSAMAYLPTGSVAASPGTRASAGPEDASAGPEDASAGPEDASAGPEDASAGPEDVSEHVSELLSSLDPSFRAQELGYAVSTIARNIELTAAAERRGWLARLLGRQPAGFTGALSAAQQRASAHVDPNSVWLHNSVRGAVGLGAAVFVANRTGVQHSFWVVLGTLSVLRSNALSTGQTAVRGLLGTVVGFVLGAALLEAIGANATLLWFLLPPVILLAGIAPAAISFAAGQAAFTLTLVFLFNIIQPAGWRIGLLRVEDIAIGCAVSLAVGLLFWPRGASVALRRALADAYSQSADYLARAVDYGTLRCQLTAGPLAAPLEDASRAAAAARRLDDAFRGYLAERGAKPLALAEVASLVTGVGGLRLAADAILDLWEREDGSVAGDRAAARRELVGTSQTIKSWYRELARSFVSGEDRPEPLAHDRLADGRLLQAVRDDLRGEDGRASATAVRMIWTGDHLDAVRRLQRVILAPAQTAATAR